MSRLYLIWSDEHRAWYRPDAAGYTSDLTQAGIFRNRPVEDHEHRIYRAEALVLIVKRRDQMHAELRRLNDLEATLLGVPLEKFVGPKIKHATMTTSLKDLDLSARLGNCLWNAGLRTVGDVAVRNQFQLAAIKNLGARCHRELLDMMQKLGIELGGEI